MIKKYYLWILIISFILFTGASLYLTHLFFTGSEIFVVLTMLLLILATTVLTDLLQIWLIILTEIIGGIFLISGISYISISERIFIMTLILLYGILCLTIKRAYFKHRMGNEIDGASTRYQDLINDERLTIPMEIKLISWAHFNQFAEINPKESQRVLGTIRSTLKQHLETPNIYYIGNGSFVIFLQKHPNNSLSSQNVKDILKDITFHNFDSSQEIQIKVGQRGLNTDSPNSLNFEELIGILNRQLETDIIREY